MCVRMYTENRGNSHLQGISNKRVIIRAIALPAVRGSQRELQHRLNAGKAPHAATDEVRQVIGVLDAVLLLVGDQEL